MTLREVCLKILENEKDLEQTVKLRIVTRDSKGFLDFIRLVPLVYFGSGKFTIEESELSQAEKER